MDFSLTEEHLMIRQAARDFAQTELLPGVIERDENQHFPDELVQKMGTLGFMQEGITLNQLTAEVLQRRTNQERYEQAR